MNPDEVVRLLDVPRKQRNDAMVRLENMFANYLKDNEKKMAEYILSLEFSQKELQDVKTKLCAAKREIAALHTTTSAIQESKCHFTQSIEENTRRLDYLDDQGRKANLRFCGVSE